MNLKSIDINNFFSMQSVTVAFPEGIVSVIGSNRDVYGASSNGSGKSTLFDAISWVLFGRTLRPIGTDDVIRRGTDQCTVGVVFTVDNREYFAFRSRGKKTTLEVWARDPEQEMTQATTQMTQAKLEELIGMDYKTFLSIATFDLDVLRFARATDKEQKEILERLLDLGLYNKGLEKVRKELADKERTLQTIADNKKWLQDQVQKERLAYESLMLQQSEYEFKLGQMEQTYNINFANKSSQIDLLKGQIEVNNITIRTLKEKTQEPAPVSLEFQRKMNAATVKVMGLDQDIRRLKLEIRDSEQDLESTESRLNQPCGECGRPITEHELGSVMETTAQHILDLNDQLTVKEKEVVEARHEMETAKVQWLQREELRKQTDASRNENLTNIGRLNDENYQKNSQIAKLQNEINQDLNTLNVFKGTGQIVDSKIVDCQARIEKADKEIADKDASIAIIAESIGFLKFWEKGFGFQGIRSVLLDEVAATITKKANEYLKHLMGGSLWIDCHTQTTNKDGEKREKFEVQTFNSFGAGTYFGNSKGEQQRIDIALSLALHDIARQRSNKPLGFCIFDEVFERLDEVGCDSIVSLLHKERANMGTVFVVSHNPNISQRFPKCIEFVKKGGITRLCEESKLESSTTKTTTSLTPCPKDTPVQAKISRKTGTTKAKATSKSP